MSKPPQRGRRRTGTSGMCRSVVFALLLAVFAFPLPAWTQAGPGAEAGSTLELNSLIAEVISRNPRIEAAASLERAVRSRIPASTRPPDPEVQFGFMNYSLPNLAPMPGIGMPQLQIMQMLPLGGKLRLAGQSAQARASAANARMESAITELRNETADLFYDLYSADQNLIIAREALRSAREIATAAQSMYSLGQGSQTDVLRSEVEVARMSEDTLRMTAMRDGIAARINALRDMPSDSHIATPVLPAIPHTVPGRTWFDSVALEGRPILRAGTDDIKAAEADEQRVSRELWPDLQVGVQYGRGVMNEVMPGTSATMRRVENMGSLMFGASIPIFARSRQLPMREEANAMVQMARADHRIMQAETRGMIGEAYSVILRSRRLIALYRTSILPQASATVASAAAAYKSGSMGFMTLLEAGIAVTGYRRELVEFEVDEGKAWSQLEMLTGIERDELLKAISATTDTSNRTQVR